MKAFVLFICSLFALTIGCKGEENKADYHELRDSLAKLVSQGVLHNDSAMMLRALSLSDSLLRIDTTRANKWHCYYRRALVFSWLGRVEEFMDNGEKAFLCLPEDYPDRLLFMASKGMIEQQKDSARFYFARLFAVCDSALNKKFDENVAIAKMKGIYLRDGKERARAFLAEQVKAHPVNTQLRSMLDDWADIANGFEQERTMHSKSPSTSP